MEREIENKRLIKWEIKNGRIERRKRSLKGKETSGYEVVEWKNQISKLNETPRLDRKELESERKGIERKGNQQLCR